MGQTGGGGGRARDSWRRDFGRVRVQNSRDARACVPRGATCSPERRHGTASDTEETHRGRHSRTEKEREREGFRGGGEEEGGRVEEEEKKREVG